jgi:hypothetical protein
MENSEAKRLLAALRYLKILTKRLFREDKYILPLYLFAVVIAAEGAIIYVLLKHLDFASSGSATVLVMAAIAIFLIAESPFGRIGFRYFANRIGIRVGVTEPTQKERPQIAARVRSLFAVPSPYGMGLRVAIAAVYVVLLLIGRSESRLIQELEKTQQSSLMRHIALRR